MNCEMNKASHRNSISTIDPHMMMYLFVKANTRNVSRARATAPIFDCDQVKASH